MIPFYLAQTEFGLAAIGEQYGVLALFFATIAVFLFAIWRNQENAKIERQRSEIERTKEDTKRDGLITDLAQKTTVYAEDIAKLRESVAEERGARNLLSEQLSTERRERLQEREDLKSALRDLSDKLKGHEEKIAHLTKELNGKIEELNALRLERDKLNEQLSDKEADIARIKTNLNSLLDDKKLLEKQVSEQSEQIQSLAKQLAELDPPKPVTDVTPKLEDTIPLNVEIKEEKDGSNDSS